MSTVAAPGPPTELGHSARTSSPSSSTKPKRFGRSLSTMQRLVVTAAAVPLVGIAAASVSATMGLISAAQMVDISLALGEEPGMLVFAAMLWCSPIQLLLGRTQVPVRKMLGILFSGYAVSNFAMFVVEEGIAESLSAPFLVAGTVALVLTLPLLVTSGRWAQRTMGMRNWRNLHKLTYVIALALLLHLVLVGELGISGAMLMAALVARIPPIQRRIAGLGQRLQSRQG